MLRPDGEPASSPARRARPSRRALARSVVDDGLRDDAEPHMAEIGEIIRHRHQDLAGCPVPRMRRRRWVVDEGVDMRHSQARQSGARSVMMQLARRGSAVVRPRSMNFRTCSSSWSNHIRSRRESSVLPAARSSDWIACVARAKSPEGERREDAPTVGSGRRQGAGRAVRHPAQLLDRLRAIRSARRRRDHLRPVDRAGHGGRGEPAARATWAGRPAPRRLQPGKTAGTSSMVTLRRSTVWPTASSELAPTQAVFQTI